MIKIKENNMKSNDKISVFISSRCGEDYEKLRIIRQSLKLALEETGLFKIFLYEDEPASIEENTEYYLSELGNSDLCLFIIDEKKHDSNSGVLNESLYVERHNIKALYIFVKKSEKNPNKSVFKIGARYAEKSYENIVCEGYAAVIKSVVSLYKKTRKISKDLIAETTENDESQSIVKVHKEVLTNTATLAFIPSKKIMGELKETIQVIYGAFQGHRNISSQKQESIDSYTSTFFNNLLNPTINGDYDIEEIEKHIIAEHPENEQPIIKKRFLAIEEIYTNGNLKKAIEILKQLYDEFHNDSNTPEWLVYDILIDLRNLEILCGKPTISNKWQKLIAGLSQPIHYPIIDRSGNDFYKEIEKESFNKSLKNYSETNYVLWKNIYGRNLAEYAVMALYNGSYTHIEQIKVHLIYLLWETFQDSPEASNYLLQLLKYCILGNNSNIFQKIMKKYRFSLSNFDQLDISSLFLTKDCIRNDFISRKWFLLLLTNIGVFTEDSFFEILLEKLSEEYSNLKLENIQEVNNFLKCLTNNSDRISSEKMVLFMSDLLPKIQSWDLIKESFSYISKYDFKNLTHEDLQRLTQLVYEKIELLKDYTAFINPIIIFIKIYNDERSNKELFTEKLLLLDSISQEYIQWEIKLKTNKGIEEFITWTIDEEKRRNEEYGRNNTWPGYTFFPLSTVKSLISNNRKIPIHYIKGLSDIIKIILENPNQPYTEKTNALDLLYWLIGKYPKQMAIFSISETMFSSAKSYILMDSETQVLEYEIKLFLLQACILKEKSIIENYLVENTLSSGYAKEAMAKSFILSVNALSVKKIPINIYAIMIDFFSFSINGTTPDFPVLATIFCLKCIPLANSESIILKLLLHLCKNGDCRVRYRILESFKYIKKIDEDLANSLITLSKRDQNHGVKKLIKELE